MAQEKGWELYEILYKDNDIIHGDNPEAISEAELLQDPYVLVILDEEPTLERFHSLDALVFTVENRVNHGLDCTAYNLPAEIWNLKTGNKLSFYHSFIVKE